jgi:hypothetical protein
MNAPRILRDDIKRRVERRVKALTADTPSTIRGEINRRARGPNVLSYVSGGILLTLTFMFFNHGETFPAGMVIFGCAVMLSVIGLLIGFYSLHRVRCPICNEPLGSDAFRLRVHGYFTDLPITPIRDCPHCGVDFDDPLPDGAQSEA